MSPEKYLGLRDEHLINATLLDAAAEVQLRTRWTGMKTKDLTAHISRLPPEECTHTSDDLWEEVRNTEAMFYIHPSPLHFNGVIALRQRDRITLIWCDSMQFDGTQALTTYSQYYHCMECVTGRHQFSPEKQYTSPLMIHTIMPTLPKQTNSTDCGIFTLMYQRTLSNWYGESAGLEFTEVRVQALIRDLEQVTPALVREHRKWLRLNMHKWWKGLWEGPTPILPPHVQQQHRAAVAEIVVIEDSKQDSVQKGLAQHLMANPPHGTANQDEDRTSDQAAC